MAKQASKTRNSISERLFKGRGGWYVAILLISAWMFVLGILVGRGTVPVKFEINDLSRELEERKQAEIEEQAARLKADTRGAQSKTDLEFYEELKKTEPPVPSASASSRPKTEKPPAAVVSRKISPSTRVEKPAPKAASKTKHGPQPQKSSPRPAAGSGEAKATEKETAAQDLTIQAASFKTPEDADSVVKKLKAKGFSAYKAIAVLPGKGLWFRVRIGKFSSRKEAEPTMKRLEQEGFKPFLIRK